MSDKKLCIWVKLPLGSGGGGSSSSTESIWGEVITAPSRQMDGGHWIIVEAQL